ncbi:hypothetical protein DFH05DRAFT_1508670 [Lentinula detonsa]|uniref:Uncharacterized protein n=1 Tax=Lentinula detonsa TaxID=2804962 RepID=A0A9W8NTA1_9AGAR|nr:hypothetical protein DFH05DRAFT_1508670 [Lentinula detonsa]
MLEFLPPKISSSHSESLNITHFFSQQCPSTETLEILQKLCCLPLPDTTTIHRLNAISHEHWLKGVQSVRYAHVSNVEMNFPCWILSYWTTMLLHVSHIHCPWVQNHDWLDKLRKCPDKEVRDEAQATFQLLAKVRWTAPKSGFSDKLPIHSLWRTLGMHWMSSTVVDNALEMWLRSWLPCLGARTRTTMDT